MPAAGPRKRPQPKARPAGGLYQNLIFDTFERVFGALRPAFTRELTFRWACTASLGLAVRDEDAGVASIVRALGLDDDAYHCLLRCFRSEAVDLRELTRLWCGAVRDLAAPATVNGRRLVAGDGVKVAKEGLRIPGVKRLHQESGDQSKAEFIRGHMIGAVGAVVECAGGGRSCVPLGAELQDGMRATAGWEGSPFPDESHTVQAVGLAFRCARELGPCYLLLDRFFLTAPTLRRLGELNAAEAGGTEGAEPLVHVVTKARSNCVACERPPERAPGTPGRPRVKGDPVRLESLFDEAGAFSGARVRIGDDERDVRLRSVELLWGKGLWRPLQFVLVECGGRRSVLATTDLEAAPEQVVELYGARFGIEHMFRSLKQDVGACGYRFWSGSCPELGRYGRGGDPDRLEGVTDPAEREEILACAEANARFVAAALIAQGTLQIVASMLDPLGETGLVEFRRTHGEARTTPRTVQRVARRQVSAHIADAPAGTIGAFIRGRLVGPGGYRLHKRWVRAA